MEITKKQWTIIGIVIAAIAVWYFFLRKKTTESSYDSNLLIYGSGMGASESGYSAADIGGAESGYRTALAGPVTRKTLTTVVPDSWVWGGYKRQCPKGMAIYNGGPNDGWCAPLSN